MDLIYLDNSASTPMLPAVWEAMRPYFADVAGNPASSHGAGRQARRALEDAREKVACLLGAQPDEVLFTSGATEANNLALFGLAGDPPATILANPIEHPCVTEPLAQLQKRGFQVRLLPVTARGVVSIPQSIDDSTYRLATLLLANHETGAIQPVAELIEALERKTPVHVDAAAAIGKMPCSFQDLGAASLTFSGHKIHGPKGIGALLVRRGLALRPQLFGGHQQHGKRPGTEAVALAVGLATALEIAIGDLDSVTTHLRTLRALFLERLRDAASPLVVNSSDDGLPNLVNVSFLGCQADLLLMALDLAGVACATGSACSSGSLLPSPVLAAMGLDASILRSAMRFSMSRLTTVEQIEDSCKRIIQCVKHLQRS